MSANLFHDAHRVAKAFLGRDVTQLKVRPGRPHEELAVAWRERPELFSHKRHERVEQPEQLVEAVVRDVLRGGVAIAQSLRGRLEIPIAEFVPRELVRSGYRILEFE